MMFELFTVEEVNLMCIFDTSSRANLIGELATALPDFDEPEFIEIAVNALSKLTGLSDDDFAALDFYPEYDDYEEV